MKLASIVAVIALSAATACSTGPDPAGAEPTPTPTPTSTSTSPTPAPTPPLPEAGPPTPPSTTTAEVGPAGAKVKLSGIDVDIPANAVEQKVTISVTVDSTSAPDYDVDGSIYKFGPEGIVFTAPITVSFPNAVEGRTVFWTNVGSSDAFGPLVTTIADGKTFAHPTHFSRGFVGAKKKKSCEGAPSEACGNCGTRTRTCNDGSWSDWSTCGGEGSCSPNATQACGTGGTQTCAATCEWGGCTDQTCTGPTAQACGNCGTQTRSCSNGTWSTFSSCSSEGACATGTTQACGTGGTQTCTASCQWGSCGGQTCAGPTTEACGNCGTRSRTCDNGAWSAWSTCGSQGVCAPASTQACGTGGSQTCNLSCQWSSCTGGSPFACRTPALTKTAKTFASQCTMGAGGPCSDAVNDVAVDCAGNTIVVGRLDGARDFGTGFIGSNTGFYKVFVAKFSPSGTALWAKAYGDGQRHIQPSTVAVDGSGNVIVAATLLSGSIDFGLGPMVAPNVPAGYDERPAQLAIAKLDANGNAIWQKLFYATSTGTEGNQPYPRVGARAVRVDADGTIVLAGSYQGVTTFGGATQTYYDPCTGAGSTCFGNASFLAKFDGAGNHLWSKTLPAGFGGASIYDLAYKAGQGITTSIDLAGTADFGSGTTPVTGRCGLVRFDASNGNAVWARGYTNCQNVTIGHDATGNVVAVASSDGGTSSFAGGSHPLNRLLLAKVASATGNPIFSNSYRHASAAFAPAVPSVISATNEIILLGHAPSAIAFDGGTTTTGWPTGAYVVRYSATGTYAGSAFYGTPTNFYGYGALSPSGAIVAAGQLDGSITVDGTTITNTPVWGPFFLSTGVPALP